MKTLAEFIQKTEGRYIGKSGKSDYKYVQESGDFGGQCVSLVYYYLQTFSEYYTKSAYGNAADYIKLPYSTTIDESIVKDGDLVIFPDVAYPYGHIGIMYQGKVYSQNPEKARLRDLTYFIQKGYGKRIFIRPSLGKLKSDPITLKPTKKPTTFKVTDDLNIRTGPGIEYPILKYYKLSDQGKKACYDQMNAVYKPGTKVTALEIKGNWVKTPSGWVNKAYLKEV